MTECVVENTRYTVRYLASWWKLPTPLVRERHMKPSYALHSLYTQRLISTSNTAAAAILTHYHGHFQWLCNEQVFTPGGYGNLSHR